MRNYWTHYGGIHNRLMASLYLLLPTRRRNEKGQSQFDSYFKFGFVRNPWDRLVSLYLRREGLQMRHKMPFDEFIAWAKYSSSTCGHPVPHVNQLDWFVDGSGEILVDFIGKYEAIERDWASVASRLDLPQQLPRKNVNSEKKKRHYTEYYTDKTKSIVAQRFHVDIEHFGYEFGD